ncbi:hypothetical protein CSKR_105992, partial [Clonorchis sinensis]
GTIFEISRYRRRRRYGRHRRNALVTRSLKTLRQLTTGFALLGVHQIGAVPDIILLITDHVSSTGKRKATPAHWFQLLQFRSPENGKVEYTTKPRRQRHVQFLQKLGSYALKAIALIHERH